VKDVNAVDLEREGFPTQLSIGVGRTEYPLVPSRDGTGYIKLPSGANRFVLTSAIWRGYQLVSPRGIPIPIGEDGIIIDFVESNTYTDRLETIEVKRLAEKFLGVTTGEQLNERLRLRPVPQKRQRTSELQDCRVQVRNETTGSESIIPTFFDCDEFVWTGSRPFNVAVANIGTQMINRHHTCEVEDAFKTMSVHNRMVAVLIAWQSKSGTRNRYRLAGFVELTPQEKKEDRVYPIEIVGDAESVSVRTDPNQKRVKTIP
jgi:hypothetical protein